ncbi:glycosyltransferase [Methylobacterium sp. V23]|uniref:glycosyltransferase n=1 Tax=Methylobacterium sp. V23 TaxID=2044878 RepID=UPI0015E1A652|nr:glycosyltransferase [Methylobacterium sp. V23]
MQRSEAPTFFGNLKSGFAGLVDFADPQQGIHGWILRIDRPREPVNWNLMACNKIILSGTASIFREDVSSAIGQEALCTLQISYKDFDEAALSAVHSADPSARLSVVIAESGEQIAWSVERPTVSWLVLNLLANQAPTGKPIVTTQVAGGDEFLLTGSNETAHLASKIEPARLLDGMISHRPPDASELSLVDPPSSGSGVEGVPATLHENTSKDLADQNMCEEIAVPEQAERHCSVKLAADGKPVAGIAFDSAFIYHGAVCVEGWFFGVDAIELHYAGEIAGLSEIALFDRPDVASGFALDERSAKGFVAIWKESEAPSAILGRAADHAADDVLLFSSQAADKDIIAFLTQKPNLLGFVLRKNLWSREWTKLIASMVTSSPGYFKKARAFIEQAKAVPNVGGLIVGWSVSEPTYQILAVSDDGSVCSLADAVRWTRNDITEAFGAEFGAFTADAGFLLALHGNITVDGTIKLVVIDGNAAFSLANSTWCAAPSDPVSFAQWSFTLPTEAQDFHLRLTRHDGPIIAQLIRRKNAAVEAMRVERLDFGPRPQTALCSLSIPLYGRFDFMLHQMLEMADDLFIRSEVELIYVVDDPRIRESVLNESHALYQRFGLPFSVVFGGVNRGFSAATNLGVHHSCGRYVVLLNSDVIPVASGWLEKMLSVLTTFPNVGAVGARLLYPNGTIQHDGLDFEWEPTFNAHINVHPGMGMPPPASAPAILTRKAVTGACVMLDRSVYEAIGKLDEEFLIGDFEDSDLCLKVRQAGYQVALVQDVSLVHLERQSFRDIGANIFRERVVRYNAWRHEGRWSEEIKDLKSFGSQGLLS